MPKLIEICIWKSICSSNKISEMEVKCDIFPTHIFCFYSYKEEMIAVDETSGKSLYEP